MIEGVELTIWLEDENFSVDLSPTQTEVILKALGMNFNSDGSLTCFGDETLKKVILPKINFKSVDD